VSAGVRLENYQINDSIRDNKPILRLGASLKLGQETYIRASLGQGYRFPTITERYIKQPLAVLVSLITQISSPKRVGILK